MQQYCTCCSSLCLHMVWSLNSTLNEVLQCSTKYKIELWSLRRGEKRLGRGHTIITNNASPTHLLGIAIHVHLLLVRVHLVEVVPGDHLERDSFVIERRVIRMLRVTAVEVGHVLHRLIKSKRSEVVADVDVLQNSRLRRSTEFLLQIRYSSGKHIHTYRSFQYKLPTPLKSTTCFAHALITIHSFTPRI